MDANELRSMCDRVLIMREGRIGAELRGPAVSVEAVVNAVYRNQSNGHAVAGKRVSQ